MCTREKELEFQERKLSHVIGIDEAGAGCLAGPVTVCACYLPLSVDIQGIKDSKLLSEKKRERLYQQLSTHPDVRYSVVHVSAEVVDEINVLQARFRGMVQAYENLKKLVPEIDGIIVDGNQLPPPWRNCTTPVVEAVIKGDTLCTCVGAASILGKVERDRLITEQDTIYPGYDWKKNKGYGTPAHKAAIRKQGLSPLHRRTFHSS